MKHFYLKTVFFTLLTLTPLTSTASIWIIDGIYYWCDDYTKTASVIPTPNIYATSTYYRGDIIIPSFIRDGNYKVTSIGDRAFAYNDGLTSVTIPSSVTDIAYNAFNNCDDLQKIIVNSDNGVYDSREGCNAIIETSTNTLIAGFNTTIIPHSVTSIGKYAFAGLKSLTSIEIPNSVTTIGECAFSGCYNLKSVIIPNSVNTIGRYAFQNCGLASVTIGNYVTNIEEGAFYYCQSLTSVTIPNSVKALGNNAFQNCSKLSSVTIGGNEIAIGEQAFYNCECLTSVTIGSSVMSIGDDAFYNCRGLTSVRISDISAWCKIIFGTGYSNPLSYAHHLFLNDKEMKDVVIPDGITTIGDLAFYGGSNLTSVKISNSVTTIGKFAFYGCNLISSLIIPNNVTSIGAYALGSCHSLTSVSIGNSVKSIQEDAFSDCYNLKSVYISDLAAWCQIVFVNKTSNPLLFARHLFLNDKEMKDVVIPDNITSIGNYTFYNCTGLTSILIPNSVQTIGDYAFCGNNLNSVVSQIDHPFILGKNVFEISYSCVLYIPTGTKDAYIAAGWTEDVFKGGIVELEPTDIKDNQLTRNKKQVTIYDLNGQQIATPQRGVNLLRMSDGTVRKVFVK